MLLDGVNECIVVSSRHVMLQVSPWRLSDGPTDEPELQMLHMRTE